MVTKVTLADEITNFVEPYLPSIERQDILKAVLRHIEFNTLSYVRDRKGLAGVVRFNIVGHTAQVLDVFIRRDCERKGLLKYLALGGWRKWPHLKYFVFERKSKYPDRKPRAYELTKLMRGHEHGWK